MSTLRSAALISALALHLCTPGAPRAAGTDPLLGPVIGQTDIAPGFPAPTALPAGVLRAAVASYERGDLMAARRELEALIQGQRVWGDERLDAHFLLGWISARMGHHQQASANFYRVRKADEHPLREYATFLEARADLLRGHQPTAIKECEGYVTTWPKGRWADECRLVIAQGHSEQGNLKLAIEQYDAFLEDHPDDQRREEISLRVARSLEKLGMREAAGRRFRLLYLDHKLPTTGLEAEDAVRRLQASGADLPAITDDDLYVRACSLRRSGEHDASFDLFCALESRNPAAGDGATALGAKLERERHEFLWKNRRYEEVGVNSARLYDRDPSGPEASEHAYWAMQGFSRAGRFADAVRYQVIGMAKHATSGRFRGTRERLALLYTGAAMYREARAALQDHAEHDSRARRSKDVQFDIAYSAYRAGDLETASTELSTLSKASGKHGNRARYYLGKVLERQRKFKESKEAFDEVLEAGDDDWYAQLIRDRRRRAAGVPDPAVGRNGRWPGSRVVAPVVSGAPMAVQQAIPQLWRDAGVLGSKTPLPEELARARRALDGRLLTAMHELPIDAEHAADGRAALLAALRSEAIPPTWEPNSRWDPIQSDEAWESFATTYAEHWPDLALAFQLSRVGLGEIGGPLVAEVYREIRDVQRSSRKRRIVERWRSGGRKATETEAARWSAALDMKLRGRDWMAVFSGAGYPASVSAFATETIPFRSMGRGTEDNQAAWTLAYPAAFAPHVWRACWENDVDPLMMLSIMRAESLYRHDAVSRVGALGLIQVMPATGARVAAIARMDDFRVERLLEPDVNIRLGTVYMGKLLDRFGPGQFPMAVGSYNGGPHNLGRWLVAKVGADLEDFVEEIAFDETRDYIKKVTGYYAVYSDLYADGAPVLLPPRTVNDDPTVINF